MDDLKPCPFCGHNETMNDYTSAPAASWVLIHRCPVIGPFSITRGSGPALAYVWNTRADDAEVLRLRDENEKLRKLDVQYGRVEAAIIMADPNFDGDSDHGNCGDRLVASVFRLRAEVERLTEALVEIRDLPDVDADNRSVIAHAALSGDA